MTETDKYPEHGLRPLVRQVTQQANDINSYELVSTDGCQLPPFEPGSHVDLHFRDGRVRQYSLSNDPRDKDRYVIAVLRDHKGRGGSIALFERVHVGRTVSIGKPRNNFPLTDKAKRYLLIGGGIGITPMKSMMHHLQATKGEFLTYYCTKSPEDTAFQDEFATFVKEGKLIYHHDGGDPKNSLDLKKLLKEPKPGTHLYCCGPPGLMKAVEKTSSHWPEGTVHFEHFARTFEPEPGDEEVGASEFDIGVGFQVKVASTGEIFDVPLDKTILEVLKENGHEVELSCGAGLCGSCKVRYLEGRPDHKDLVLNNEEKSKFLSVCISRSYSSMLVLDL
ncbi:MAG: oxidoreductase [Rhodospirillaceae bacterium]|nr:oxidoreductase [Rhodospirillaceae bacterium]